MVRIPTHRRPPHPGEILLEEYLQPMAMTQVDLAVRIGVTTQRVNEIVRGKRGITPDTALRLEAALGASAQSWLNAQVAWDLYQQMHSPAAAAIKRIRRVPVPA